LLEDAIFYTTQNYGYETLFIVSGAIAAVGARLIHRCSVTYFDFEFDYLRKKASQLDLRWEAL
jgi:hypothetical protein